MPRLKFRHALVAVLLAVAMLAQGTWALAGTTGGLAGTVVAADTNAPLANAKVTVSSPSETTSISTDASGRFNFLSLIPDTYTVSVDKEGYTPVSQPGVSVFADAVQQLALRAEPALKTIAKVTSRASSSLVHPGTTADVYSVNASTQDKINALGGGGSLNSAYSAVASVPGAFVPLNQTGYYQTVHIRGGDYDQVGYELDGVPVNRSFDNYPSGALSSLGQQEVQIYTGAAPSNSEGQGLAGYINQVIKTGTFPGFGTGQLGIGSPTFYHKASAEVGGATPDRNFSYYVGLGGYNQEFRYVDNTNGAGYSGIGAPLQELGDPNNCASAITGYSSCYANGTAGPGGFAMAGPNVPGLSSISDRDVIANVHFGLPHKHDGGKDDVQLLWDSGSLANYFYFSTNDQGGAAYLNNIGLGAPTYTDGYQWNGPVGVLLPSNYQGDVSQYFFPQARQHPFGSEIPANERDSTVNNQEIFKAQYQKNFGSSAYLRLYGYTYYSNWLQYGPQTTYSN
ncbi:MAG: carboxypeptidase regulatory-like domain-containing protein, partial [Vulcanimicrobiaceae bacterium]